MNEIRVEFILLRCLSKDIDLDGVTEGLPPIGTIATCFESQ